jgi:hypothetical protein
MRILHEACVVTLCPQDDLWRTERRSSGWMVGDVPSVEPDALQLAADSSQAKRPRSDWSIGDVPADVVEAMQLALVPVGCSRNPLEGTDPIVASALTQRRIVEFLLSDDGSPRADPTAEQDETRRPLA